VRPRTAAVFGLFTMVGGFAGARLAQLVSGRVQLVLLSVLMLAAALTMLRRRPPRDAANMVEAAPRLALLIPVALAVGVLTALVGIGGGFLIVPALVLLAKVPMRQAVGTSLLVISLNAAAGFVGYLGTVSIDWPFLAGFTGAVTVGTLVGTVLMRRIPQAVLTRAFAVLLLVVGGLVLYLN
jgi:uncharacterized membrane protein YfcA